MYSMFPGGVGIPKLYRAGQIGNHNVMIIDRLDASLEDLFNYCDRRFSLKTVLMIADQLLTRIERVHSRGIIHRDIKPDNFLIGLNDEKHNTAHIIHLIDFGLAINFAGDTLGVKESLVLRAWEFNLGFRNAK